MRRILLLAILFLLVESGYSQLESTAFSATGRGGVATTFATDYQTIGINPANLGFVKSFRDPFITFGFGEVNSTITAEPLTRDELFNAFFNPSTTNLSFAEKEEAAKRFANKSLAVNMDAMLFGVSIRLPKNIGIAFNVRDRVQLYTRLGDAASELAFLGSNASYFPFLQLSSGNIISNPRYENANKANPDDPDVPNLTEDQQASVALGTFTTSAEASSSKDLLKGSRISASWYREFNFSVGTRLYDSYNFSIYAGVGYREIRGLMNIDMDVVASGDTAVFNENYLSLASGLVDFDQFSVRDGATFKDFLFPSGVAKGRAVDLGITMVIKRNLYIGMAITNWGQVKSADSTYAVGGANLIEQFSGGGFSNYNVVSSTENEFAIGGERSPIRWDSQEAKIVDLPSTLRLGASYEYLQTLHVGFDVIFPLNNVGGNLEAPLIAIGGEYRLNKLIKLSSGLNIGGNNGGKANIPLGVTYTAKRGSYEAGIATRDISTYFSGAEGSTLSLATGFLRFKISKGNKGKRKKEKKS